MAGFSCARDFDDAPRQEAVGRGDDEQARMFDAGGVSTPGAAASPSMVGMPCDCAVLSIRWSRSMTANGKSLFLEHRADGAADAPVADEDGVVAQTPRCC